MSGTGEDTILREVTVDLMEISVRIGRLRHLRKQLKEECRRTCNVVASIEEMLLRVTQPDVDVDELLEWLWGDTDNG